MKFKLSCENPTGPSESMEEIDAPHAAAAMDWARARLAGEDGNHVYKLTGGNQFSASLVRTAGGQWYAIGQPTR